MAFLTVKAGKKIGLFLTCLGPCDASALRCPVVLLSALGWCWSRCVSLGFHRVPWLCLVGILRSWEACCVEVRAGWQDPSLRGHWPWREMKEVHVCTLAAQTGLQSSVKARPPPLSLFSTSPLPLFFFDFRWGGGECTLPFRLLFSSIHSACSCSLSLRPVGNVSFFGI